MLVDTGMGRRWTERERERFGVDPGRPLSEALGERELCPEDITDVLLTHLHFDHAGGLTSRDADGHLQPTFGNARHWIQSEHLDWARGPIEKERGSFPQENIEPIVQADLFALTRGEEELFRGIRVLPLYGHTKAMQAVLIDGERPIFYPADLVPLKAHLYLSNIMAYDVEPLTTLREKKRYLKQALKNNWLVYFEHEPTETFGAIEMFGGEYRLGTT